MLIKRKVHFQRMILHAMCVIFKCRKHLLSEQPYMIGCVICVKVQTIFLSELTT